MGVWIRDELKQYILNSYKEVPSEVYEGLISFLCIGTVGLFVIVGWKKGWKKVAGLILAEYVFLIYCSTVICRKVSEEITGHNFTLFWSYEAIKNGREDLVAENIMNVVVFIPVGILLFITQKKSVSQLKAWIIAIASGLALSVGIESLQLIFKKGFAEVDDLMHNTLGCFIGCTLCLIIVKTWSYSMNWCKLHWGNVRH